ncbi:hypothetical protein MTP99_005646 [Tenebrio molitor]|nr:hypothetical protein MTP99_005646 [Tenebrio molitor]
MEPKVLQGPSDNSKVPRKSLGQLLLQVCNTHRNNTAVIDIKSGESLTFGQLCQLAKNLAASLRLLGAKKSMVGVVAENSHKFLVTYLAGFFLATPLHLINPTSTEYELKELLTLSKPTIVFCSKSSLGNVVKVKDELGFIKTVISFDGVVESKQTILAYADLIKESKGFQIEEGVDLENQVGLVLNSSGTSGLPKGVMVTEKMLWLHFVHSRDSDSFNMKPQEVVPLVMPFFHMYAIHFINVALYSGATIAALDRFNPEIFLETCEKYQVEQLVLVPYLINFLTKTLLVPLYDMSSVRQVWTAGSSLMDEDAKKIKKRLKLDKLHVLYGLTESGIAVHTSDSKGGSCGTVLFGHRVKIVDPETGVHHGPHHHGEICIGDNVMKGYLANPEKTRETIDPEGFVRTGDIGYYDDNGVVYVVGRSKDIIKYKSFQVSPVELENILVKHPQVKDAAVVGKTDRKCGEVPVAFVVREMGGTATEEEICDFVAGFVSAEKRLHGGVRFVEAIPKNITGKVSRKELTRRVEEV